MNTHPNISFAVSQVACFNHNPKQLHATALKMILCYLKGTTNKGMIIKPSGKLTLEMWCDADYAGLYHHDPDTSASAAKSCGAFLITLSDVPFFWKMQLHSEITLSTTEAEYSTLSMSLHALLPIRDLLLEVCVALGTPREMLAHVHCCIFQDNSASHKLANDQRLTNHTKYFLVKWHWF